MTGLVVTVAPSFATVTTDSLLTSPGGQYSIIEKIAVFTKFHAVATCAGSYPGLYEWADVLHREQGTPYRRDVRDIIKAAPDYLSRMWRAFPASHTAMGLLVVNVGWTADGPVAAAHEDPDFAPLDLPIGVHCMQPGPDQAAPGYEEIVRRWAPAGAGIEVSAFHILLMQNQKRALDEGRVLSLTPRAKIGGPIISARIDERGILTRCIGELT